MLKICFHSIMWTDLRPSMWVMCVVDSVMGESSFIIIVCNQWQNSKCMGLSCGCTFCTCYGWNGYKTSSFSVHHTHVYESLRRVESLHGLVVGLCFTISRMFSCSSTCWRARSDKTWALGSVPHSCSVLNTLENTMIRHSAHRKPSTVFFNSSSGITIAEAINVQHISVFGICEDVQHFAQHSSNVTINSHDDQLTLHTNSHASDSGTVWQEEGTILGTKSKLLYSVIALPRKPFGIGHLYTYTFLLRMTDAVTSQNIDLSSWDTLYMNFGINNAP